MKTFDVVSMGMRNLLRRKVRTLLTVVGVVVGTTAIVVMVSLGIGMNKSLEESISRMGDLTVIELKEYSYSKDSAGKEQAIQNSLTDDLVQQIKTMDGVIAVTPYLQPRNGMKLVANKRFEKGWVQIIGVYPEALPYFGIKLSKGEMPVEGDKNFLIFGEEQIYEFSDPKKPIRDWYKEFYNTDGTRKPPKIDVMTANLVLSVNQNNYRYDENGNRTEVSAKRLKKYPINKVSIMEKNDNDYTTSYYIYGHIDTVRAMILEQEKLERVKPENSSAYIYETIKIKAKDLATAESIQTELKEMGISTYGLADQRKEMQQSQASVQFILAGIGAMSLIVAAIGIANTMIMSIYERTREIGVMKVLGCPLISIKIMFLFEASMIGLFGGILGVGISYAASFALNNVPFLSTALGGIEGSQLSVIPVWLIGVSIIFSTIIGLLSGYFPADRATKISALEAIKNEG